MDLDRLGGVLRARRAEATRRGTSFGGPLVPDDEPQEPTLHQRVPRVRRARPASRSVASSAEERPAAAGEQPTRYRPGGIAAARWRSRARSCRRSRLRTTAGPTARPMAKPTCGRRIEGSANIVNDRTPHRTRVPSRRNRAKASRPCRRPIKPTAACGPSGAGCAARRVRPGCSSVAGTRASSHGASCWAGRCASRRPPGPEARAVGDLGELGQTQTGERREPRPLHRGTSPPRSGTERTIGPG